LIRAEGEGQRADGKQPPRTGRSAFHVGLGIFSSRIVGLIRSRVIAHYFGLGYVADAWASAFRIPNLLQNLFGDQALSASFIPVYSSLLAKGDGKEADRVAGAVASLLALVIAVLVALGVVATPLLIDLIAPGFSGERRELTISLVRILFPGVGLLVLSAWCLGVLNSHHRFLVSYTAPVVWNAAMIGTLIVFRHETSLPHMATILAWGSVAGSFLMFAVQLPIVLKLAPGLRLGLNTTSEHVRTVGRNFAPAFVSRGVVQLSGYIDMFLASFLGPEAVAAMMSAQTIGLLPVSLFGMSVSAAELPAMSGDLGVDPQGVDVLRRRLNSGLRQIAFFVIPSAVAFLALGDQLAAALFVGGRFTPRDAVYVWAILAGSGVGLLASTLGRLYSSTYWALRDTRTPLRYAVVRVALTTIMGYFFAIPLPRMLNLAPMWGAAGLTASAGIAGWFEMLMLRRTLNLRIGHTGLPADFLIKMWAASLAAAAAAWAVKWNIPATNPRLTAIAVVGPYGLVFFAATLLLRLPEASTAFSRLRNRF
jgi:putative peptidoglycan lipid II flippase